MPNQILLYDTSVKSFIETELGSLLAGKTFTLMTDTPDRAFAEYVTPTGIAPDGRPPLPRGGLVLGDPELDPERFNPNKLRLLGYNTDRNAIRQANYPVSVRIPYSLNLWTEYRAEMVVYMQRILQLFNPQYHYIDVDLDSISPEPVYGTKKLGLFAEGGLTETGDLEPGNKERIERRTFDFHMKAWIWDYGFVEKKIVRDVEVQWWDDENSVLLEVQQVPGRQTLAGAVPPQVTYSGTVDLLPIIENTFLIDATVGGSVVRGFDDGAGSIVGTGIVSGSVNYTTGDVSITYSSPPDAGTLITVGYFTVVHAQ